MEKFRVEPLERHGLIYQDPSQPTGYPCIPYLEIDTRDGSLHLSVRSNSENGVPIDVWHGIVRRIDLPRNVNAASLTYDINRGEYDELFARICDGTEVEWDSNNFVGRSNDDAEEAMEKLAELLSSYWDEQVGLWDAGDWLQAIDAAKEYGITADTTDEELEAIAERIEKEALPDGAVVVGTVKYLEDVRYTLREETE